MQIPSWFLTERGPVNMDLTSKDLPYQPNVAKITHLNFTHTRSVFLVHRTHKQGVCPLFLQALLQHLTNGDDHF